MLIKVHFDFIKSIIVMFSIVLFSLLCLETSVSSKSTTPFEENVVVKKACKANEKGPRIAWEQKHEDGTKLELICEGGFWRFKLTLKDGSFVYVGRCAFANGYNVPKKITESVIIRDASGKITSIKRKSLSKIDYSNWHADPAPPDPPDKNKPWIWGPPAKDRGDKHWTYDHKTGKGYKYKTLHDGIWTWDVKDKGWYWGRSNIRIISKKPFKPSSKLKDLEIAFLGEDQGEDRLVETPAYVGKTLLPFTDTVDGELVASIIKILPDSEDIIEERIIIRENALFNFDVNYHGEDLNLVFYKLTKAPEGMTIGRENGVISWSPMIGQAGEHLVELNILYPEMEPIVESFLLPVKHALDDKTFISGNVLKAFGVILILGGIVLAFSGKRFYAIIITILGIVFLLV